MITNFKIFENVSSNMLDVSDIINVKIAQTLTDIRDDIKAGDTVFYTNFEGSFITYKMVVEDLGEEFAESAAMSYYDSENDQETLEDVTRLCRLGASDDDTTYTLYAAYFVFSYEDYIKLDPHFEIRIVSNKYNL